MANTPPGQQLNDLLVTRNFEPQALDASGKPAPTPAEATTFSFNYIGESGKDYGTVVVMLGEDNVMNVFFGDNVGKSMEGDDKKEWFDFLYQLRQFAKRNLLTFSLQNLNKLKYSMQGQAAIKEGIFESWSGRKDVSYNADATQARLMIKHKRNIGENEARFRNIDKLFIETAEGERFRLPFKSLSAGRAMLEHVRQGGTPYDHRGQHIVTIVTEMNLLSRFRRANQGKIFEGETAQLVEQATEHYTNLHQTLKSLSSKTGYQKYFESWNPAAINDEDVIIEDLRHMFVEQNIDSRIEQALPLLARLKQETAMKEINVFEGWMNLLSEGTWALPDTPEKQQKLIALLADELPVGPDASNATELLYDLLGDDELFDKLGKLAQQDANADARTVIIDRLEQMKTNPAVAQVIGKLKIESTPQPEAPAEAPPVTENALCETCNEAVCECDTYESINESIERLAELSGTGMKRVFKNGEWVQPEVKEASDTVEKDPETGRVKSWSHDGDWKKIPKRDGKPVDPRGEVTNMAGKELQRAKSLKEDDDTSPVESAIINRIMRAHPDLLQKYGPEAVMTAARDQAEWVGDVDEIGSSDVSAYVAAVVRDLESSQINELSPDTLKSYIKKAGSSSHKNSASNLASRAADKLAQAHNPGVEDDGYEDDHKSYMRSKGIGRAVDRLEEISDETVERYKDKAWDEFARGNDRRGAGIGRALDKQRGAFGHVKTTGQDKQLDENDVAQRVDSLNWEMMDLLDQAETATPEEKAMLKQKFQAAKKARNELLGGTLADSPKGKLDELAPDTLKSYIKRASSDRAIRNFDQGFDTGKSFDQREPDFDADNARRDDRRRKGIHRAVDRLTQEDQLDELSPDTLKSYIKKASNSAVNKGAELGQKMAAADEVDRYTNRHMPNQSDERERMRGAVGAGYDDISKVRSKANQRVKGIGRASDRLEEGGMSEVDLTLQEIAHGAVDIYGIYANPKSNVEKFVSDQIHDRAEEISRERGIPMDDNIDKILEIIQADLQHEYGVDESVGGGNFLESTALTGQYGHSGRLEAVKPQDADMMDRIKFLAGITK